MECFFRMTPDMIMTMIILVFVICLFVFEWVRVDVVGIMMMVLLPLIGLISPKEAFVGLSSNAVCFHYCRNYHWCRFG